MPKLIYDEYTDRTDLSPSQKSRLRNPEKFKNIRSLYRTKEREKWAAMPVEKRRAKWLKTKYKLSYEEYESMYKEQDGKCYVCDIPISITTSKNEHQTACVDHCHDTGKVRKLLCNHCNRAIGLLKEDITVLENIITYLRSYK